MKKGTTGFVVLGLLLLCGCQDDARKIWREGIKKCAQSDLLGSGILYLGPSTRLGPGTIFQRLSDGGLLPSHLASEYIKDQSGVLDPGAPFTCAAHKEAKSKVSGKLDLSKLLSSDASLSGHLNRARTIDVKTDSLEWVSIVTGPYRKIINDLDPNGQIRSDLGPGEHLVLTRALRVKGMSAELEFSKDAAVEVKATLPQNIGGLAGTGVNLAAEWQSDTKLKLTSTTDFFIAGELHRYRFGGLASVPKLLGEKVEDADKLHVVLK
ncbi:MAG: hypothetical protein JNN07_00870 [Verrucomicrobiales bacterium]|nr:hypothetical protein [Verrucomicrobiales bacterium]